MAVSKTVLGMNARNFLYIKRYNPPSAKKMADNKLLTKRLLLKKSLPTPDLFGVFEDRTKIREFNWNNLPKKGFVIKPARGYGGGGILAFKNWENSSGIAIGGEKYSVQDLESHILDILDGAYSLQFLPDKAFIEERIIPHSFYKKLAPLGIPDVRIIVFNHIPVMAMLRVPTRESKGKANLHMGAIGIGIDIRTGITTHAILRDQPIIFLPSSKQKTRGIKIPDWDKLLVLATKAQSTSNLGYAGIDIVVDAEKGHLVLEINARPGLSIQNANLASLRERLERVENMPLPSIERGVEMAKSLFTVTFLEKIPAKPKILKVHQKIKILGKEKIQEVEAKLDTGAERTSIDKRLAKKLKLEYLAEKIHIKSATGEQTRLAVKITFILNNQKINTTATVTDRSKLQFPVIIGRKDLTEFLIDPS